MSTTECEKGGNNYKIQEMEGKKNTRITTLITDQWISLRVRGDQNRGMSYACEKL